MATLFESTTLNGMTLKNRFVRSATFEAMADDDGVCKPALAELLVELATTNECKFIYSLKLNLFGTDNWNEGTDCTALADDVDSPVDYLILGDDLAGGLADDWWADSLRVSKTYLDNSLINID